MAERLTPGVYVELVSSGIKPIQGVGTSTAGFIGEAARGIPGVPTFVRGFADFDRFFGGHRRGPDGYLAQGVEAFFAAGGARAFVVRVLPADAHTAQSEAVLARADDHWGDDRAVLRITARGAGSWADHLRVHVTASPAFPDRAFGLAVEWVEGGRGRVVERFDPLVLDPESPDSVVEVVNGSSRYIRVTDLFRTEFLDADPRPRPPLPDRTATLLTRETAEFRVPLGGALALRWSGPDGVGGAGGISFDATGVEDAGGAVSADGREAVLTPGALQSLLATQLGAAFTVAGPGRPAVLTSTEGPWDVTGGPDTTVRIDGTDRAVPLEARGPARLQTPAGDLALDPGDVVSVAVDGRPAQEYTLSGGDVPAPGAWPPQEAATVLNRELTGIQAFVDGGALVLRSDTTGAASRLEVTGPLAEAFGAAAGETARDVGGQVQDLAALTAAELAASFNAALSGAFQARADGQRVRLVQVDLAAHSIQWAGDPLLFSDTTLHEGPVADGEGAVQVSAPVATSAYLVARAPGGTQAFDLGPPGTLTLVVTEGDGASGERRVDLDTTSRGVTPLPDVAAALTAAVTAAGLDDLLEVTAAGSDLVVRAVPRTAGTRLALTADTGAPWERQDTRHGAAGTEVEDLSLVEVVVTEALRPGRPRALPTVFTATRATGLPQNSPRNPDLRPAPTGDQPLRLRGGTDGTREVTAEDVEGREDATGRTGLKAFDDVDIQLLVVPGRNQPDFLSVAMTYADRRGVFYIADGAGSHDRQFAVDTGDVVRFVEGLPSRCDNAAMFYPWIEVSDPVGVGRSPRRFVPPSGHVAGVFARTDRSRGVWKAPAGLEATIPGALDLQHRILDADQDLLNPIGLNCLRQRPGAGIVSWGARTLSSDPEWRYTPVRRTALFIVESLRRGLQWVVFEPNDVALWGRIRGNIEAFMLSLHRQGAFQGATPEEAFAVKCDAETNPQELIDQGVVTAQVAFSPLKPAEFVVVQVSQKTLLAA